MHAHPQSLRLSQLYAQRVSQFDANMHTNPLSERYSLSQHVSECFAIGQSHWHTLVNSIPFLHVYPFCDAYLHAHWHPIFDTKCLTNGYNFTHVDTNGHPYADPDGKSYHNANIFTHKIPDVYSHEYTHSHPHAHTHGHAIRYPEPNADVHVDAQLFSFHHAQPLR
eukprot:RCo016584